MRAKITRKSILESYDKLIERAKLDPDFILLTMGAAAICSFGFRMNSSAVIVGAMVISPLLYSVVSVGAASFKKDWKSFSRGTLTLLIGLIAAIAVAIFLNLFFSTNERLTEIVTRLSSAPVDYFFVAFFSGLAGTFAFFWPEIIEAIAGIAISVALLPPVVLIGMGIAHLDYRLVIGSGIIVAINAVGIYLGSFLTTAGLWLWSKDN